MDAGRRVLGVGEMGVRRALMETEWSGGFYPRPEGRDVASHGRCRGRALQVGLLLVCLLFCVSPLLHRGASPELGGLHWG